MSPILLLLVSLATAQDDDGDGTEDDDGSGDGELGEILVVTGTRTDRPLSEAVVSTDVITEAQIQQSGARTAAEVLETAGGVQVEQGFAGASISLQGLDPRYVLVLVDGQRVLGRRDGVVDLSRIPADQIERVEIVKGPASSLYGSDAIGGVVNILTRRPREPFSTRESLSYGSRNTVDASASVGLRRGAWSLGGDVGAQATDGYDLDPDDVQTDGPRVRQATAGLDGAWELAAGHKLLASYDYVLRDSRRVDLYDAGGAVFDSRNLTEEGRVHLGADLLPGPRSRVQVGLTGSLWRDQLLQDQRESDDLDAYEETVERLLQADALWSRILGRHTLTTGLEGADEQMESPRLTREGIRYRGAVFAEDEWDVAGRDLLQVVPGVRIDGDSWFGVHPTPRVALRLDPTEGLALRASGGTGFRAPTFKEMFLLYENPSAGYRVEGNPDLGPESSWNVSAGFEGSWRRRLVLRVDGYQNRLSDMIDYAFVSEGDATTPALYRYENVAEAVTRGAESVLTARFGPPTGEAVATVDLGYTWTWTRNLETDLPLEGRSPHRVSVTARATHPSWGLGGQVRGQWVGTAWFYDEEDADGQVSLVAVDPYALLSARVEQRFLVRWTVFLGVDNVLDAGDARYHQMPPRTFYGGLTFETPSPTR